MKKLSEMNDKMKAKYAELFINALDTMEAAQYKTPWVTPNNGEPCNIDRKRKPYKGVNAFLLSLLGMIEGYETPYYVTMTQIKEKGLQLNFALDRNGLPKFNDKGLPLREGWFPVYWFKPIFLDEDGKRLKDEDVRAMSQEELERLKRIFALNTYSVWNIDQTDFKEKFPDKYEEMTNVKGHEYKHGKKDLVLEKIIMEGGWRCPIQFGGHSAHYNPTGDNIRLPERRRFLSDEMFYGTAIHEMAHSTAVELKRSQDGTFGSEDYAMEEFIAELTSACVCSMVGVGKLLDEQHIAYVAGWRKAIREQDDFIPKVIDHVQRASNYILKWYDRVNKELQGPVALPLAA